MIRLNLNSLQKINYKYCWESIYNYIRLNDKLEVEELFYGGSLINKHQILFKVTLNYSMFCFGSFSRVCERVVSLFSVIKDIVTFCSVRRLSL